MPRLGLSPTLLPLQMLLKAWAVCQFCLFLDVCIFSMVLVLFVFFFSLTVRLLSVCLLFPLSDNCIFTASMLGAGECHNTFPEPGRGWLEGGSGAEGSPCRGGSTDTLFLTCPGLDIVQLTDTWCEMLDPLCPFFF